MAVVVSCYWLGARGIGIDYCTIVLTCKNVRAVAHVHTAGMTFGTSSIGFDRPTAHNMQRKRHPSLEARRVARIGTSLLAAAALWRLLFGYSVFFCVFFRVACALFFRASFSVCLFGSHQYLLSNILSTVSHCTALIACYKSSPHVTHHASHLHKRCTNPHHIHITYPTFINVVFCRVSGWAEMYHAAHQHGTDDPDVSTLKQHITCLLA